MMIQMLVHPAAPLLRSKVTKEGMRMPRALRLSTFVKLANLDLELLPFPQKFPLIRHYEFRIRGTAAREWLLIGVNRLDERPDQPAINRRARLSWPEATSSAAQQCAIICATSIFPQSRCVAGCSVSMREITSSTASR